MKLVNITPKIIQERKPFAMECPICRKNNFLAANNEKLAGQPIIFCYWCECKFVSSDENVEKWFNRNKK